MLATQHASEETRGQSWNQAVLLPGGDRRKERQRSLERLKQRGRNRDAYGDWNGVDQIQGRIQKVRDIQKTSPGGSGRVGVQGQAGEGGEGQTYKHLVGF